MAPGAVRTKLGISRADVARWASVNRDTVSLYEAKQDAVKDPRRVRALAHVYDTLRDALAKLEKGA